MTIIRMRRFLFLTVATAALACVCACENEVLKQNERQVQANQAQIEEMQRRIAELQAQQGYASAPAPARTCDKAVMKDAMGRGADAFAAGDLVRARGYYQDALTACPGSAKAEVKLARVYETMGKRTEAITHYRAAASSAKAGSATAQEARVALSRLGVSE